jgi:hypothetical protein
MRFIFGVIIGIALTIAAALIHDNNVQGPSPFGQQNVADEQLVNWDALGAVVREYTTFAGSWWDGLMGRRQAPRQP